MTMTGGFDWNEGLPYTIPQHGHDAGAELRLGEIHDGSSMSDEPGADKLQQRGDGGAGHIFRRATGVDIEEYARAICCAAWH